MASLSDIYSVLLAGKKIKLRFSSAEEAETFRVAMHRYKRIQDNNLLATNLMEESEKQRFVFSFSEPEGAAVLSFAEAKDPKQYEFEILEPEAGEPADE